MRNHTILAALAVAPILAATLAYATDQPLERSPQAIQKCLCMEQTVAALNSQVQAQSRVYEDKRQVFQTLDNQVRTSRSEVNVNNQQDVDAFRRLLEQRDEAADTLAGATTSSYAEAVTRYNQSVAAYNDQCAGKAYDADQLAQIRAALNCPKQ